MTLSEIVTQVAGRLNLTSDVALARIADDVQEVYRKVMSGVGLSTITRGIVTADTVADYRYVTFSGLQKLYSVFNDQGRTLLEFTFDTLRNAPPGSGSPSGYAISTMGASSVTLFLDNTPSGIETLSADALVDASVLSDNDEPAFSALFHDILTCGALAIELLKMEKADLAAIQKAMYEDRLSDLRFFIAKSAYLRMRQGERIEMTVRRPLTNLLV